MIIELQDLFVLIKILFYKIFSLLKIEVVQGLVFVEKSLVVIKGEIFYFRIECSESNIFLEVKILI